MPTELIIVLVVGLLLLFSAKKLPEMARGLGQSMRVFKAETRGLRDDERSAGESVPSAPAAATDDLDPVARTDRQSLVIEPDGSRPATSRHPVGGDAHRHGSGPDAGPREA